jgi:hypothetical protein
MICQGAGPSVADIMFAQRSGKARSWAALPTKDGIAANPQVK